MEPKFFKNGTEFRAWLDKHHETESEVLVGYYKKASGKAGPSYQEILDEALAYGWIDGITRSLGEESYTIRYTPRRKGSIWSAVNIKRVGQLEKEGRMHAAGLAAFAARDPKRAGLYSSENRDTKFGPAREKAFRANKEAWAFFEAQPPGYRRTATFWVESARKDETKERRLEQLIVDSTAGRRIAQLTSPAPKAKAPK